MEASIEIKDGSEVSFPDYQTLICKIANSEFDKKTFVVFNPDAVNIARKMFGSSTMIMRFYKKEGMFLLFPGSDSKAFVGIMPMLVEEKDAVIDFSLA